MGESKTTVEDNVRFNYIVISMLWDEIVSQANDRGGYDFTSEDKKKLYDVLGTNKSDFSSIKTGKKKLTQKMEKQIAKISLKDYPKADSFKDGLYNKEQKIKMVLFGKSLLSIKDVDVVGYLDNKNKNDEMRIGRYLKQIVNKYYTEINEDSGYFSLCIWLSMVLLGDQNNYASGKRIRDVTTAFNDLTIKDMEQCDIIKLENGLAAIEKKVKEMRTVYEYRKLVEKGNKSET